MSTIPFTTIEGYLAIPRLRPLGQLPESFGRDWALLPPVRSLRAELKTLYAALLRTFCLSDQAIRSLCRWSPLEKQRAAVDEPANSAHATLHEALLDAAAQTAVDAAISSASGASASVPAFAPIASPIVTPAYGSAMPAASAHWSAWAGGACVLGGAAMLAWIGLGHLVHRPEAGHLSQAGRVSRERDAPSATLPPSAAVVARADHKAATNASAMGAMSAPPHSGATPKLASAYSSEAAAPASKPATASRSAPTPASVHQTASKRRNAAHGKHGRQHEHIRQHGARFGSANEPSHATPFAGDVPRGALLNNASSNAVPKTSAAGPYSPLAPSRLGIDDYAGITMSAATHLHDYAPTPRTGSSNTSSNVSATEWTNHLSQRRIIEVPDQFVK